MRVLLPLLLAACAASCAQTSQWPESAAQGPDPKLPPPQHSLIPTIAVAPAAGWPEGVKPVAAPGTSVTAFATKLEHPRWVYVLPNGDVLVSETAAPKRPAYGKGLRAKAQRYFMTKAGSVVPSANRITLLRDTDGDGVPEVRTAFLEGLNSPLGIALVGNDLYVANTDAIVRYPYKDGDTRITAPGVTLTDLPAGPRNHHWTKNVIANRDGSKLYATVGSNSNIVENGLDVEEGRAAIYEIDTKTGTKRLFATGLRNANGLGWEPASGALWTVVNERDELGHDLVPDYLTSVREGAFYGWPFSYYGQNVDTRAKPPRPDLVAKAVKPDYALGNHVAPLGLVFANGNALAPAFANGAFVGEHGSWNRRPPSGYSVVFVPFRDGKPTGEKPVNVLTGFLSEGGDAYGRPVGVAIDKRGALLVADDVGNAIWRVTRN
jgi:glucose/arabinose dehydrogenase